VSFEFESKRRVALHPLPVYPRRWAVWSVLWKITIHGWVFAQKTTV